MLKGLGFDPIFFTGLLTIPSRYRPYKSASMQMLSCSCAVILVLICGLLLRSLVLVSAGRSPNFDTTNPSIESSGLSEELTPVISLLILLLALPFLFAIIIMIRQHLISKNVTKSIDEASATSKQMSLSQLSHFQAASLDETSYCSVRPIRRARQSSTNESSSCVGSCQEVVAIESSPETAEKCIPASPVFGASISTSPNSLRWSQPYAEPWPSIMRRTDQSRNGFV